MNFISTTDNRTGSLAYRAFPCRPATEYGIGGRRGMTVPKFFVHFQIDRMKVRVHYNVGGRLAFTIARRLSTPLRRKKNGRPTEHK